MNINHVQTMSRVEFCKSLSRRQILNSQKYIINSKFVKVEKIEEQRVTLTLDNIINYKILSNIIDSKDYRLIYNLDETSYEHSIEYSSELKLKNNNYNNDIHSIIKRTSIRMSLLSCICLYWSSIKSMIVTQRKKISIDVILRISTTTTIKYKENGFFDEFLFYKLLKTSFIKDIKRK